MPGAAMPILNTVQPIVGLDVHISLPPIPPAPAPHLVVWGVGLSGWMGLPLWDSASTATSAEHPTMSAMQKKPVVAWVGHPCGRGHDAGPHLGHIAPNTLLVIIWIGAASKAEFASGTVNTPQGRMAVNVAWAANVHLDCGDPVSTPLGFAITLDYTVCAGFTWTDFLNGLVHMVVDFLIDAIISVLLGAVGILLGGVVNRIFKKHALIGVREALAEAASTEAVRDSMRALRQFDVRQRVQNLAFMIERAFARDSATRPEVITESGKAVLDQVMGLSAGGPTGADAPYAPYGDVIGGPIDGAIDGLFYGP